MSQDKNERIFISYKREDRERVFALKDRIEQATGEKCWIDLDGIESNAQFVAKIVRAIDECEVFLFMRSKEHNNITNLETDWTIREVNYALEEHKNIVIVSLDNTPMPKWFKFMFPNKQEIDATDSEKLHRLCKDLCDWLGIIFNETSQSPKKEQPTQVTPTQATIVQELAELEIKKHAILPTKRFQVGGLEYKASKNGIGVTVCGCAEPHLVQQIQIPDYIQYNNETFPVDRIANFAFLDYSNLRSITIPNSVRSIGNCAFKHCSGLTSITIPNSVTSIGNGAFALCSSLTSVTIPNSVTSIRDNTFYDCSSLAAVTLGNSVTSIGEGAFRGCKALKSIKIPKSVTDIGFLAFPIFTEKIQE